jgi:hypothetical protein
VTSDAGIEGSNETFFGVAIIVSDFKPITRKKEIDEFCKGPNTELILLQSFGLV